MVKQSINSSISGGHKFKIDNLFANVAPIQNNNVVVH